MSTTHKAPRTRNLKRLASVLVTVTSPRQICVRVPHGRTATETLLRAVTKAQSRIIVHGTLTS